MKYKSNLQLGISSIRKCYPFKLRGKQNDNREACVLKVICRYHNNDLLKTLVGHPFTRKLKSNEHLLLVGMTKSQVKYVNILLNLKENNEYNVITTNQLYIK